MINQPVNAFTSINYTIASQGMSSIDHRTVYHPATAQLISVSESSTLGSIHITVTSNAGVKNAEVDYDGGWYHNYGILTVACIYYDATQVLINVVALGPSSAPAVYVQSYWFRYNVVTYNVGTLYYKNNVSPSYLRKIGYSVNVKDTGIVKQGSVNTFFFAWFDYSTYSTDNIFVATWFDADTNIVDSNSDYTMAGDDANISMSDAFYLDGDRFFYSYNWGASAYMDLSFYIFDISAETNLALCNGVNSGRIGNDERLKYYGGGVVWNGTLAYVYSAWSFPIVSGTTVIRVVYDRQIYNNTISSATLIAHKEHSITINTNYSSKTWTIGYLQNDLENFYLWYPEYIGGNLIEDYMNLKLSDFNDYTTSSFTTISYQSDVINTVGLGIPMHLETDNVYYKPSSPFVAMETYAGTLLYVYYSVSPTADSFAYTLTVSPADSPLDKDKTYSFTYLFTNNGAGATNCIVLYYIDNSTSAIFTKVADSNGRIIISFSFGTEGVHSIGFKVYKNMVDTSIKLQDVDSYVVHYVEPTGEDITPYILTNLIGIMTTFLPACLCIMVPAMAGAKSAGLSGFIGGSILGVALAIMTGIVPQYFLYIMILVAAISFVMVIRTGNRGVAQ